MSPPPQGPGAMSQGGACEGLEGVGHGPGCITGGLCCAVGVGVGGARVFPLYVKQ